MALINGNDYDHIDFTKNGVTTRHMLKDTLSRQMSGDLVKVQNEEPTSEGTKIWIKPSGDSEVQVPTYEEFEELSEKIDDADAIIESLAVGAQPTVSVTEVDGHKRFSFGIPASNGIASITKTATDGVIDTYTIAMTDGTSTSFSVNNSDITPESMAEAIATALQDYARIDGYYPDLTAGNADQLNSTKFVENKEPYLYRPSGGTSDIGNRKYLDAIVGVSLPWNQMVRDEASENETDFAPIVTVDDAVEDAAGVKVKIEPVQDLHGYDHPWPAGGGINRLDMDSVVVQNAYGFTVSKDADGFFNIVGTYTGTASNPSYAIASKSGVPFDENMRFLAFDKNADAESCISQFRFTDSNGGLAVDSKSVMVNGQSYNMRFRVVECSRSETPTAYIPYSNICPITGWDGVKVTRTGKNLLNFADYSYIGNANVIWGGGTSGGADGSLMLNAGTYTFSVSVAQTAIYVIDKNNEYIVPVRYNISSVTFMLSEKTAVKIQTYKNNTTQAGIESYNYQLELGSTATAYEPYAGQTYDITLPTEAGTVYGGELTVNADGSGSLVVDSINYDVSNDTAWGIASTTLGGMYFYKRLTTAAIMPLYITQELLLAKANEKYSCGHIENPYDHAENCAWVYRASDGGYLRIGFSDEMGIDTVEKFNEWRANNTVQIYYPLLNSTTYTLTASEIRTLLGQNNVWADTGDLALTYTGTDEHLVLESGKKYLTRLSGTDSMLLGSGQEITAAKGTDNVFDLTQMFGTAVADYVHGQGASFFRKWFPNARYPYNAGELLSVEGLSAHDMVGFNQWNEEWEVGRISTTTGTNTQATGIRSKNFIPVLPLTAYFLKSSRRFYVIEYDANKNYVRYAGNFMNGQYTTSANAHYIRFYNVDVTTYSGDICISLSHNGSRNGEYAPYEKHSYPLDSSVILRGIPKVGANGVYWDGDRYLPDGTVERRYGVVDLGALTWTYNSKIQTFYARIGSGYYNYQGVCSKYPKSLSTGALGDKTWNSNAYAGGNMNVLIKDTAYTDAATFKAAMSGVYLVYELATPTTETAQPYHSTQWVSDWGTEEFVSTGLVPVGHETRYPANLRDKLQHLPDAASGNGSYLITQTDGQMVLTPFPAPPSTAGNYVLKATVVNGVATYTWEVAT